MLAGEWKARFRVIENGGQCAPIFRCVALGTIVSQLASVWFVGLVAIQAAVRRLAEFFSFDVATAARGRCVPAFQGVFSVIVVESDRFKIDDPCLSAPVLNVAGEALRFANNHILAVKAALL